MRSTLANSSNHYAAGPAAGGAAGGGDKRKLHEPEMTAEIKEFILCAPFLFLLSLHCEVSYRQIPKHQTEWLWTRGRRCEEGDLGLGSSGADGAQCLVSSSPLRQTKT